MPFLHAEHALLAPRRASSRTKKSMFLELEGRLAEWRVDWSQKTLDIFCQQVQYSISRKVGFSHIEGTYSFSQKNTEEQNTQGSKQVVAPPPSPPPKGRGVITEIPL